MPQFEGDKAEYLFTIVSGALISSDYILDGTTLEVTPAERSAIKQDIADPRSHSIG